MSRRRVQSATCMSQGHGQILGEGGQVGADQVVQSSGVAENRGQDSIRLR